MNMSLAEWSSLIAVGCPRIDAQHKEIFDLAASFDDGGDEVRVMKTIATLCEHVKTHFQEEEALMAAHAYPGLEAHRQQHDHCREMLVKLLDEARQMNLDQLAAAVKELINGWIYKHIMAADFDYVPYLSGNLRDETRVLDAQN
jgi:hemerythrin